MKSLLPKNEKSIVLFRICFSSRYLNMLAWNVVGTGALCNDTSTVKRRTPAGMPAGLCSMTQRLEKVIVSEDAAGGVALFVTLMVPSGACAVVVYWALPPASFPSTVSTMFPLPEEIRTWSK